MELNINNEITNKQIKDTEITDFINELSSTLEKKQDKYGRIIGEIALISKNTLPIITDKTLEYPRPYGWTENLEKQKSYLKAVI